jgi:NADH dehydrogenase [ubiquinone] 1 alpha subcomplex assembly factor 1
MLFDFEGGAEARWRVESDRVMGGRSTGSAEVAEGALAFAGEVVTEGGGFSSVRAGLQTGLTGYDGIELRVRGGGRTFELDVSDGTKSRGREVTRRGSFPTSGSWETVRVPFDALEESAHGEPVSAGPIDLSAVESIGIYIIDGKDGPFRLEVDWIRAYRKDAHREDAHREDAHREDAHRKDAHREAE